MLLFMTMLLTFMTLFLLFYTAAGVAYRNRQAVGIRLDRISKEASKNKDDQLSQPLFVRIVQPVLDDISKTVLKVTPREMVSVFEKKVVMAGKPYNFSVKEWINIQVMIILCLPLLSIVIGYYRGSEPRSIIFASMIEIALGLVLPVLILNKKVAERQRRIINALPDVLDLLTVSVEAGLGFDGALTKVTDKMPGPLADEFGNVLQEMKVGKQKKDALKDMADRVGVQDLTTFVGAIIQADQLGVSIGNVLRLQSEQMRQKRRQTAQEKAMKAPVKMLIPMVLFIFPTLFSVLLGPVVIRVMKVFMK